MDSSTFYNSVFFCLIVLVTLQKDFYTLGQRRVDDPRGAYDPPRLVCYYLSWLCYFPSPMAYFPESIPQRLCDEIVYYHSNLNEDTFDIDYENYDADIVKGDMQKIAAMRANVSVVMLAIGGYEKSLAGFSRLASNKNRQNFTKNVVVFLKRHNFNGFLIDWTYPGTKTNILDRRTYVEIVKDLSEAFREENFILAITGTNTIEILRKGYNIRELTKYVDEIHVKSYQMWGTWKNDAFPNNPLHEVTANTRDHDTVENTMKLWLSEGAERRKLFIGITLIGTTFQLSAEADGLFGSRILGAGKAHRYSNYSGEVTYYEVCGKLMSGAWEEKWDDESKVPYAFDLKDKQWASYENPRSAYEKAKFAKKEGYGGIIIYGASGDDFRGLCGPKYSITKAIKEGFAVAD